MALTPYNDADKPEQPGANLMPNPDQVNEFHRYSDQDTSPEAQHHSLGNDPNQASPGNHNHDGRNSELVSGFAEHEHDYAATVHSHPDGLMQSTQLISQDMNIIRESGYYDCNNCTNVPPGANWWHILHLNHNNNNGYVIQKAWRLDGFDEREWIRQQSGGSWGPWRIISGSPMGDWFVWAPGVATGGAAYQAPTSLLNSWVPADTVGTHGPPGYRKDAVGTVRLRGITKNNASNPAPVGSVIANLPAGYRPRDFQEHICAGVDDFGNSAWGHIRIERGGNIVYNGQLSNAGRTAHTWISLDGINFVQEN